MIKLPKPIRENLLFLIAETQSQVSHLEQSILFQSRSSGQRILDRAGYSYNLRVRIQNACWAQQKGRRTQEIRLRLQAIESIAHDLHRITEIARMIVNRVSGLDGPEFFDDKVFKPVFKQLKAGLAVMGPTMSEANTQQAIRLRKIAEKIEKQHQRIESASIEQIRKTNGREMAAVLLAAHGFQQMGETLFAISESLLSAVLGQAINFDRLYSLEALNQDLQADSNAIRIETIAETRSGSAISGVAKAGSDSYTAIFKGGERKKLKEEKEGFETWHELYPGLAPKVLSYQKRGENAALLIEHLSGLTLENIALNESQQLLEAAVKQLGQTLRRIWRETEEDSKSQAQYMAQLDKRLPEILSLHRDFNFPPTKLCGLPIKGLRQLISEVKKREVAAPFSVYIHGDFNLDNIIFDPSEKRINFIDLHRSRQMDYVQDVSVFMVSCYRLQVLEQPERKRLMWLALEMHALAKRFAQKQRDKTFEFRLALGLARSFVTSTRFILDPRLSRRMFLKARFILEHIVQSKPGSEARFRIPLKEIFHD